MKRFAFLSVSLMTLAGASVPSASAGGFFVPGAGPQAQGRAGAFTAKADDPTAISHNPSGFAKLDGTQLYVGANFLRYNLTYQRFGSYEESTTADSDIPYAGDPYPAVSNDGDGAIGPFGFQALPSFALSTDLGHPEWPVRFGVGIFGPQAYPYRKYPKTVTTSSGQEAPAPQRYDNVSQDIVLSAPSIVVAYSPLDNLNLGFRGSWGFGTFEGSKTVWTLRNYEEDPGKDSTFELRDAKDNFIPMVGLSASYQPSSAWEIGVAWNSPSEINAVGRGSSEVGSGSGFGDTVIVVPKDDSQVQCAPGGEVGALKACLNTKLPQNATVGARWIKRRPDGTERGDIELDVRWENWSASQQQQVLVDGVISVDGDVVDQFDLKPLESPRGYQDVLSTRLGGSYQYDLFGGILEVRGGLAYDTATAPDSWARVDQDVSARATMATGLGFSHGRYRLDLGLGYVWEPTLTLENNCRPPNGPSVGMEGCSAEGEVPVDERDQPSPGQPLFDPNGQRESPFNAGRYESNYVMFSTGLRVIF